MELQATVTETGAAPRNQLRAANDLARAVGWQVGAHWFRTILPKHFTHRGATEYGYAERTPQHNRAKLRKYGHTYPLVFSSKTRDQILANAFPAIRVTAVQSRATIYITIPGSQGLNRRASPKSPNMAAEVRRVSESDKAQLSEHARSQYATRSQALTGAAVSQLNTR